MKKTKSTILIICEGQNTEPLYFKSIENELNLDRISYPNGVSFKMSPTHLNEQNAKDDNNEFLTRKNRKKSLQKPKRLVFDYQIEIDYKSEPIKFIREAQLELKDNTFQQVWVVFDKDGVPDEILGRCFELAETDKVNRVNIAFSSISIENWFLCHYEKSSSKFIKSECRIGKNKVDCQKKENGKIVIPGCGGEKCIVGYMRKKNFKAGEDPKGKNSVYPLLAEFESNAYINASWQRFQIQKQSPDAPIFKLNPFTNMDIMLKSIRKNNTYIEWFDLNTNFKVNSLEYLCVINNDKLIIKIKNLNVISISEILNGIVTFEDINHNNIEEFSFPNSLIFPKNEMEIQFPKPLNTTYLKITTLNYRYYSKI